MRTITELFADPELFATSAIALLVDRFGAECINWEQETMEMEVRGLGVTSIDEGLFDKISAATTVLSTDTAHVDTMVFNNIVQVFNLDDISPNSFIPASLEDILWGCSEMRLLEGIETYESAGFSPDIKEYVGKLLVQHGITTPPPVLEFANISEDMILGRDDNLGADSIMFEAYWSEQRDNVTSMKEFTQKKTDQLMMQLSEIPFKNADNEFSANIKSLVADTKKEDAMPKQSMESAGRKTHIRGSGDNKATIAARPLPAGTDLGNVIKEEDIITPQGQAFTVQDLKEFVKRIKQAVPGNTQLGVDQEGDPRLYTTQPIQQNEVITTDLRRQSVIPQNLDMLVRQNDN